MTSAICFKCGSAKSGALIVCRSCGVAPRTHSELATSLVLSDHLSPKERLTKYSDELRSGKELLVPSDALVQALDALKDPQLLAMLGQQPAVPNAGGHTPSNAGDTPQPSSSPATSRSTMSTSIAVSDTSSMTQGGILREAIGIETSGTYFTVILSKGCKLPCAASQVFSTAEDGQDQITLHLCSGDASLSKVVQSLGRFRISGIAPMPKGKPSLTVEFKAEIGGITLKATDTGSKSTLDIRRLPSPPQLPAQSNSNSPPKAASVPPPLSSRPAPSLPKTALHQSPFAVLGATIRDDRRRIVDLADEKSLELDHDVCQKARSDLTNPRTRLSAEMAWLPGVSPRKAIQLIDGLQQNPMAMREESGLPTLAHLNLLAAAFESVHGSHDAGDLAEFIEEMAYGVDQLSPDEVLREINEDRTVSGFSEAKALDQIEAELTERKRYYRNAIKDALDRLPSATLVRVMTMAVDGATAGGESHAPSLIDDLVDSYEAESQSPLQSLAENIHKLIKAAKETAPAGEATAKLYVDKIEAATRSWDRIAQPIQLSAKARGMEHDQSNNLGWDIRSLAIALFNEHDMLTESQRLTSLLQELFSEIPEIAERAEQDSDALENIASGRNELADNLAELAEKFKDFGLSGNFFKWKNRSYDINTISHIGFYRAITTHKTNFVESGKTEKASLTLALNNGQTVDISIDEQGLFWNKNLTQQIQSLTEFYGFLLHVTFDQRLKFYEDQIERNKCWLYDECHFYPHNKVVFRGREFDVKHSSFLRSYGCIELRKKDYGLLDKIKREVALTKIPQFSTLIDTDVIFHMLEKHMGLRWNS